MELLTDKQRLFVENYTSNGFNQKQAMLSSGYTESTSNHGTELVRHPGIRAAIEEKIGRVARRCEISIERILDELACVAFFDEGDMFNEDGTLKQLHEISESTRRALSNVRTREVFILVGEGDSAVRVSDGYVIDSYKVLDKMAALEKLGKFMSMFKDQVQVEHKGNLVIHKKIDDTELEERIAQITKGRIKDALQ